MASNDDVISTLNGLIETNKDGQEGFKTAAEGVQNSDLKSTFYEYAQQRSQFAGEQQNAVRELGGDPCVMRHQPNRHYGGEPQN